MTGRVILATILILAGGGAANYLRFVEPEQGRLPVFGEIPLIHESYSGEEHRFSEQSYEILRADTSTLRVYTDPDGVPIWLFVGYFKSQKYGSQIHSPKHCLPGSGWKITSLEPYRLDLSSGFSQDINRLVMTERDQQHLMFYWFETRGGTIRNEFALKWDLMVNSLLMRPTDAAIVRVSLPMSRSDNIEAGTERALAFLEWSLPHINRALPFGD